MGASPQEIYICSSRLGLIKMDHHHSGVTDVIFSLSLSLSLSLEMVETVSNEPRNRK
jgi:hypothetical protein